MQDWDAKPRSEDGSTKSTSLEQYYNCIIPAFERAGLVASPGPRLEKWFREAGFTDIHVKRYRLPMGTWPKDKRFVRCIPFRSHLSMGFVLTKSEKPWGLEFAASRDWF